MQNNCAEFKIRAEIKAGEFLADLDKQNGRPSKEGLHDVTLLRDLGIEKTQSYSWQKIATIPVEKK